MLVKPRIDTISSSIVCQSSIFTLPKELGSASIGVHDVIINSKGLQIQGGEFKLPNFKAGNIEFSNIGAHFKPYNGGYEIGGQGKILIQGIGELDTGISITPITTDYPIGLKYAYFSFQSHTGGIPIGPIFLNGIRGSLGFGPPGEDLPIEIRDKMGSG